MAQPYTQDVLLDADGRPLFNAMETVEKKLLTIQKIIKEIEKDSFKTASDFQKTLDTNIKAIQKGQSQMRTLSNMDASERRAQRLLAADQARTDISRNGGTAATRAKYELDLEKETRRLRHAANEEERIAGIKAVEMANARLRALTQIEAAERRIAAEQTRRGSSDDLNTHRQRLALSRSTADQNIRNLGATEAIARQKALVAAAETKLAAATGAETIALRRNLELETARLRATERLAAQQERATRAAAGGVGGGGGRIGPESRIGNILSPGYAGAAFARTSVYGAAAMAAYGAFNFGSERLTGAVQLEDELMKLAAISNSTDTQMQKLKSSIFEVGSSSRYSNVELVQISQTLAQAGIGAEQMEKVLRAVTTLATASGSTPNEAVQLVTSALGAFQLQGSEAARVANLMTEALNRTKLTVQQTGQAIQYVGATAYEQNISLEAMLATIGAVAQAGVKSGSTIGTGFRQFLVDLQSPSKKLSETLADLKLNAADVDVSTRGLPAVLETLQKAGFGAAQAYEGLEVRAAAFYLTAKNNVDIIDKLQLSFSYSNAAAEANAKAMNSLTAQWQRFKNILDETLNDSFQSTIDLLKDIVKTLADTIESMRDAEENLANRKPTTVGGKIKQADQELLQFVNHAGAEGLKRLLNGQILPGDKNITGLGDALSRFIVSSDGAAASSARLRTQVSETSQKVDDQRGLIAELDKEMLRLIVQKEELRNNDARAAAETVNLTSRFAGLASQLTATGNRYDDLTQAAKRYRSEQLRLLSIQLGGQNAALVAQAGQDRRGLNNAISTFQNDRAAMSVLNSAERAALSKLASSAVKTQEFQKAFGTLTGAVSRLAASNAAVSNAINTKIVQPAISLATASSTQSMIAPLLEEVNASLTEVGQFVTNTQREVSAAIERLGPLENGSPEKINITRQARASLNELERLIEQTLKKSITTASRQFLMTALAEVKSSRTQIDAMNKADKEKAERVSTRDTRTNKQVFEEFSRYLTAAGVQRAAGRTGFRTAADQNDIYRNQPGATNLDGYLRKSRHQTYQAFDPTRASHDHRAAYEAAAKAGLKGFRVVPESGGRFHYEWTGHEKPGTGGDFDQTNALAEYDTQRDKSQLTLDRNDLRNKLKAVAKATTQETFDAAVEAAAEARDKVNQDLRVIAEQELAALGLSEDSPQYRERMLQLQQEIEQNGEEYQLKVAEALVKNTKLMLKAAQSAFDAAIRPMERSLAIAESTQSGLSYYSLQGKVPDYTAQLAAQRTAQAKEALDRARLQALPAQISSTQSLLDDMTTRANSGEVSGAALDTLNMQIQELTNNLEGLKTTRDSLAAAFGAEGLLPKTLGEGLAQAAEAYRSLHGMNLTFTQSLNNELGGAIATVHQNLETMFTGMLTGSMTAGQAFLQFGRSIIQMIGQIAAKLIATQVINMLLSLVASVGGSTVSAGASPGGPTTSGGWVGPRFNGGPIGRFQGGPTGYSRGGGVRAGLDFRDSVHAMLAKGEWVINKRAVDSVGPDFMHDLNKRGAAALQNTQASPKLEVNPRQEVNVWMVKPDEKPSMGPNDVLVTWQDDVLRGGQSRKLIEHISRESR